jgi:peptidyl-prolyl cis-trans isomerase C
MFKSKILFISGTLLMGMGCLQSQTLVSGHGILVEAREIRSDVQKAPAGVKEGMARPEALHANLTNIFVRRVLASNALKTGVDKNPLVIAAIAKARERILSEAMLEQIDQSNQPSLQDIEAYARTTYKVNPQKFQQEEQVKIRHILIRTEEPDAKMKIEAILKELQAGGDFDQIAKSKSQDPGSAAKGGDLGWVGKGRTVKNFEDAAIALVKPGQISGVTETPFGLHIIKLDEKKPAGLQPFEEVKDVLMKEAQAAILNEGRFKEQDRILKDAKFDKDNIEKLAQEFANP